MGRWLSPWVLVGHHGYDEGRAGHVARCARNLGPSLRSWQRFAQLHTRCHRPGRMSAELRIGICRARTAPSCAPNPVTRTIPRGVPRVQPLVQPRRSTAAEGERRRPTCRASAAEAGVLYHDRDYVFPREDGEPYYPRYLTDQWGRRLRCCRGGRHRVAPRPAYLGDGRGGRRRSRARHAKAARPRRRTHDAGGLHPRPAGSERKSAELMDSALHNEAT
jgi:hypothetical protein